MSGPACDDTCTTDCASCKGAGPGIIRSRPASGLPVGPRAIARRLDVGRPDVAGAWSVGRWPTPEPDPAMMASLPPDLRRMAATPQRAALVAAYTAEQDSASPDARLADRYDIPLTARDQLVIALAAAAVAGLVLRAVARRWWWTA